jgi:hypothetical protein
MPADQSRRRRTDLLTPARLPPTARAALDLVIAEPGISIADLGKRLGIGPAGTWEIVNILEHRRVHRRRDFAAERAQRAARRK